MTTTTSAALADPRWLAEHLSDPDVRVVEVDVSVAAYADWHIEGATLWNVYADLKNAEYRPVDGAVDDLLVRDGIGARVDHRLLRLRTGVRVLAREKSTGITTSASWTAPGTAGGRPDTRAAASPRPSTPGDSAAPSRTADCAPIRSRCAPRSTTRPAPWSTSVRRPSSTGNGSGRPVAWSPAAAPAMCRRRSTSRSTGSTTTAARSARPRNSARSSPRSTSTAMES